jgi:class 3 adenylate cyclase
MVSDSPGVHQVATASTNGSGLPVVTPVAFASLETFTLFDLAEAAATEEGEEWGEDPGLNLLLEDSLTFLRQELESVPMFLTQRMKIRQEKSGASQAEVDTEDSIARGRIWVMCGALSSAVARLSFYQELAKHAEVWVLGVPDVKIPAVDGIHIIPLTKGTALAKERSVVVDTPYFGAALFAVEAGELVEGDETRYYEGFLTTRPDVLATAAQRFSEVLHLPPSPPRVPDRDITAFWQSRLNLRLLEQLESQKLALQARTLELLNIADERARLEKLVRSYVGGRTWDEVQEAVEQGRSVVSDRREELTICFCDLVGFTTMSERLHPTEIAAILNDHYGKMYDIVRTHGGWIDKFIGDAMLAVFGSPVKAMEAAQKMVRDTRSVNVTEAMTQRVEIRVGLNTGIVAVANLGTIERRERTVLGDAVNTAQRLQSAAHPQSVLVSARTVSRLPYALARTLEPLELTVKGKREPIVAYRWTAHGDRRAPDEKMALRETISNSMRRTPLFDRLRNADNSGETNR